MATREQKQNIIKFIKKWEGGFSNHPDDKGGATMKGITIAVFRRYFGENKTPTDLKNITEAQWEFVFDKGFWNPLKGDLITNESIAQLCVDMCWGSGTKTAIKKIQRELGLKIDGVCGPITLAALNAPDTKATFVKLWNMRYKWFQDIAKIGNNKVFLKGWLNRLNDIKYIP